MSEIHKLDESAFKHGSICIVGNINRDVKTTALRADENLFRDGETSVSGVSETIGGGGANSAFAAAALGARVSFIGKVGADGLGNRLEKTMTQHGITAHLARDHKHASGTSIALPFDNGQRHFISCLPASRALSFEDIDLTAMKGCRHLLRADVWFAEAMLKEGNKRLFEAARQEGMDVSIDLNWDPHWCHASAGEILARKQSIRAVLPWVNLVHGNVRELTEFADQSNLDAALKQLTAWGAEAVVVHLGEKGAGFYQNGSFIVEPPVKTKARVNTAGTGDVLSVCMMLLHRHESSPAERLRLSNKIVAEFIEGKREFIPLLAD